MLYSITPSMFGLANRMTAMAKFAKHTTGKPAMHQFMWKAFLSVDVDDWLHPARNLP